VARSGERRNETERGERERYREGERPGVVWNQVRDLGK
jgi:hypothetical protein